MGITCDDIIVNPVGTKLEGDDFPPAENGSGAQPMMVNQTKV